MPRLSIDWTYTEYLEDCQKYSLDPVDILTFKSEWEAFVAKTRYRDGVILQHTMPRFVRAILDAMPPPKTGKKEPYVDIVKRGIVRGDLDNGLADVSVLRDLHMESLTILHNDKPIAIITVDENDRLTLDVKESDVCITGAI